MGSNHCKNLSPRVEENCPFLLFVVGYGISITSVASSPLIYQFSLAAGTELEEVQLAERISPVLYLGWLPLIIGPSSGRSISRKSGNNRSL